MIVETIAISAHLSYSRVCFS